jgi:hypothetical protein
MNGARSLIVGLLLTATGTIAAILTVPEFRELIGLNDNEYREKKAKDFLIKYLSTSDTTLSDKPLEPKNIANYFNFPINNYYGERDVSRDALIQSIAEYHSRWPYRSYSITEIPKIVNVEKKSNGYKLLTESTFTYECRRNTSDNKLKISKGLIHLRIELLVEKKDKISILSIYEYDKE